MDVLFNRCVIDDGGVPLASEERVALIAEMDRRAPQVDLELDLSCPECGHSFTTPFDCTAFFFSEIRAQSRHLMREVHYLALHYHWSEAEILGLQRHRRRDYLALLNETLAELRWRLRMANYLERVASSAARKAAVAKPPVVDHRCCRRSGNTRMKKCLSLVP